MTRHQLIALYGDADARDTIQRLRFWIDGLRLNLRLLPLILFSLGGGLALGYVDHVDFAPPWVLCLGLVLFTLWGLFARLFLRRFTRDLASLLGEPGGWTAEEGWEDDGLGGQHHV